MIDTLVTVKGLERLNAESARLRAERESLVERMWLALELGRALPESGEFLDARHELELLDRRLALVDERLHGAEIVDPRPDGEVEVGERVTVLDLETGATSDYVIVGSGEGDPASGHVSYESPIGSALLGRRVGSIVETDAPAGRRRLEIVELDG